MARIKIFDPASKTWIYADRASGKDGADGKSAYDYAKDAGFTGTEAEFAQKLIEDNAVKTVPQELTDSQKSQARANIGAISAEDIPSFENLATYNYVDNKIADLINSAPEALDNLNELAKALGDDPNFAATIANQIGVIDERVGDSSVQEQIISAIDQELNNTSENAISNKAVNNAITNLNNKFQNYTTKEYVDDEISTIVASIPTLRQLLLRETMVLSSLQYGTTFPTDNLETGRIFYKKVT